MKMMQVFLKKKEDTLLAVVADGMGGHLAGDVASRMAVSSLKEYWEETSSIPAKNQQSKKAG
ncbi:hypothetical protein BsIDN1_28650 [Bacillus safensis]|uniref:PPM-type phosphatase domain-containing protein n=1 Tax=Bacillus safensis TaxID=561879 RepID=A0A5S9M6W3_BACIA|nr:hypothetical protein BsIDN1_28650 [Bacillus safensis]